jgi:hypothetical protein
LVCVNSLNSSFASLFHILVDALSPSLALNMQDFSHEENLANQMDATPAFSPPAYPTGKFGSAEAG